MNSATAVAYDFNSSQFRHFGLDTQAISASANDAFDEDTSKTSEPVKAAESGPDRNPYPELALSVQKLEALAHEMAHLR